MNTKTCTRIFWNIIIINKLKSCEPLDTPDTARSHSTLTFGFDRQKAKQNK